jgi:U6 snRNA phosphodiesterase
LADLDWVPNFDNSRWFLVFRVRRPDGNGLNKLLAVCNETVEDFSQPPLYASSETGSLSSKSYGKVGKYRPKGSNSTPKAKEVGDFSAAFHFSIGWTLENPRTGSTEQLKVVVNNKMSEVLGTVSIGVNAVKVKVGNAVTSINLTAKAMEGKGLFGA